MPFKQLFPNTNWDNLHYLDCCTEDISIISRGLYGIMFNPISLWQNWFGSRRRIINESGWISGMDAMRRKTWLLKPTLSVKMHRKVRQKVKKGGGTGVRVEQVWIFWQLAVPGANTDHTGRQWNNKGEHAGLGWSTCCQNLESLVLRSFVDANIKCFKCSNTSEN